MTPCPYDYPAQQTDFEQYFIDVNLREYLTEFCQFEEFITFSILDSIFYENEHYPIGSISLVGKEPSQKLLILSSVHGNETAGLFSITRLLQHIQQEPELIKDWEIRIIAPVNPVGVVLQSRYNKDGCDLNRRIKNSDEIGTVLQREIINTYKPDLIISLHEAFQDGFFMFINKYVLKEPCIKALKEMEQKGIVLASNNYAGSKLKTKGLFAITGGMRFASKVFNVTTLDMYCEKKGIGVITSESDWKLEDIDQRINSHLILIKSMLQNYKFPNE